MFRLLIPGLCLFSLLSVILGCKPGTSPTANDSSSTTPTGSKEVSDAFLTIMAAGKNALDQHDTRTAVIRFKEAVALSPTDPDARLNLANAHLLGDEASEALAASQEVLKLDPESAAAYFIVGSAQLRMSNPLEAVKALENVRRMDPGESAAHFQLGMARMGLKQWDEAAVAFKEGIALSPNRIHSAAHYQLSQALIRAGKPDEGRKAIQNHEADLGGAGPAITAATFERSRFTATRIPFRLDQPDSKGITVRFVDATRETFGGDPVRWGAPVGVLDLNHRGWNSLFVTEPGKGFRLLINSNGVFTPQSTLLQGVPNGGYHHVLVGDLQNDRFDDVVVLGDTASHVFRFTTNGVAVDATAQGNLQSLRSSDGLLMDIDFTGKLDLAMLTGSPAQLQILRQFGPLRFTNLTVTPGMPLSLGSAHSLRMEDWNRDKHMDLIVGRTDQLPVVLEKQRGGGWVPREITNGVAGSVLTTGDFDNDLRPDLAVFGRERITLCMNGGERREINIPDGAAVRVSQLVAMDHDNDGWLDLWLIGSQLRAWRNRGQAGFQEVTAELGLSGMGASGNGIKEMCHADFDGDCDPDVVLVKQSGGLVYLRNEGGNANQQVKVNLFGNRSNASGLGCRIEIQAGGLRLVRTVQSRPVEIGVGKRQKLDSFLVHWFNWPQGSAGLGFDCRDPIYAQELSLQEGSCPFLYAWDGKQYRFVTDILGASPLGLPLAAGRYIDSDPEELVWIGDEHSFQPRNGNYEVQITEELREVLYLDHARLVVVDHEPGTEVHSTDKLLPGKPFPPGSLTTLHREHPLRNATTLTGRDVTVALKKVDGIRVSPVALRSPQLRGLAEPHGVVLDFGALDTAQPLLLVMNGWLKFGGGMANIAASHDPQLPYPFPILEAEIRSGTWQRVDVNVGAPAGKTKTILVDLRSKLPEGTTRLRLTQSFEIHWDRIALLEAKAEAMTMEFRLAPQEADLHFRGFSAMKDFPADWPLTPDYGVVSPNSPWTVIPEGWCTRYGAVLELVAQRDEGLALIHSGDELTLKFPVEKIPVLKPGMIRQFFLEVDGWDKDSDFHVATGDRIEPLPFHGMNDQEYGRQQRPNFPSDVLHRKYNTRWVDGKALRQLTSRSPEPSANRVTE